MRFSTTKAEHFERTPGKAEYLQVRPLAIRSTYRTRLKRHVLCILFQVDPAMTEQEHVETSSGCVLYIKNVMGEAING